ncbi:hypothetical protein U9M48_013152 [Paspalum notatum var. saurae]|uniref:Uncharacterized protein n=1 Tax=Paspalum notatum var. saurae TaxID=547442 RepID=A0AAQ3T118_PASNO
MRSLLDHGQTARRPGVLERGAARRGACLKPRISGKVFPSTGITSPKTSSRGEVGTRGATAVNRTALARPWWRQHVRSGGWGTKSRRGRAREVRSGDEPVDGDQKRRGAPERGCPR